ncbi:hypothetical protein CK203_045598 [Vitis vinifera]|uniref:Uncharacterized protein n=1 Tax=Vitis vinifera TaxID=29760 RepID=A0A438HLG9_VITVI|nr:hypothetical protein CK203_045598 [Vitis vinifera]
MERGQLLLGENPSAQKVDPNHGKDCGGAMGSSASSTSKGSRDLSNGSESFRRLEVGVPNTNSSQKKLSWLRSQIVGGDAEFSSPLESAGSPMLIILPQAGVYATSKTTSTIMFFPSMVSWNVNT